jgi:hypothetical protein
MSGSGSIRQICHVKATSVMKMRAQPRIWRDFNRARRWECFKKLLKENRSLANTQARAS